MIDMNTIPDTPSGSRIVTKREMALGILNKPTYRGDYSIERYMRQDDVVSFKLINHKNDFNAEFSINDNTNNRIWLSQLNRVFIEHERLELSCGIIWYKNGEHKLMGGMMVHDFLTSVEGRCFRVEINNDLYAIDLWDSRCINLGNCGEIQKYIKKAFEEERYNDVKGMTKSMPCYSLKEI